MPDLSAKFTQCISTLYLHIFSFYGLRGCIDFLFTTVGGCNDQGREICKIHKFMEYFLYIFGGRTLVDDNYKQPVNGKKLKFRDKRCW